MTTELYIVDASFAYLENLSKNELINRLRHLAEDYDYIRQYNTEKVYYHENIFAVTIFPGYTVERFLYDQSAKKDFSRNELEYLRTIIRKSKVRNFTTQEVIEILLNEQSENTIHGLLALHEVEEIDKNCLIYNKNNWLNFHRHFLGKFPINEAFYIEECKKYFPNIFIHERCKNTIADIFNDFVKKIIEHLSCLNDVFFYLREQQHQNESEKYRALKATCKLDEDVASKDDNDAKENLTFEFVNDIGSKVNVTCYPHLRLARSDNYPGDGKYYPYRIYFHEGLFSIENKKILVGHIGKHL